jgi:hypothetical protein
MAKAKVELSNWEKVCKKKGISPVVPFDVSMLDKPTQNYLTAAYKLPIIIEAANGTWKADYTDTDQWKYELWLRIIADKKRPSGFALSYDDCDNWYAISVVGVRFAFKDRGTAEKTFEENKELFEHFFLKIA